MLDTKEKRQAVPSVGRVWLRNTFPIATPDQQWRMSIGHAYGGNALSPVTAAKMQSSLMLMGVGN